MRSDLAVIVVSTNEATWLTACLSSVYQHAGRISLEVVVADNESTDGTRELVESVSGPVARHVSETRFWQCEHPRGSRRPIPDTLSSSTLTPRSSRGLSLD